MGLLVGADVLAQGTPTLPLPLFGLTFRVDRNVLIVPDRLPSHIFIHNWGLKSRVERSVLHLRLFLTVHHRFVVQAVLDLKLSQTPAGWSIASGVHPQGTAACLRVLDRGPMGAPGRAPVEISGYARAMAGLTIHAPGSLRLGLETDWQNAVAYEDGRLTVRWNEVQEVYPRPGEAWGLPLQLDAVPGGAVSLDLSRPALQLAPGSLRARISAQALGDARPLFSRDLFSREAEIPLDGTDVLRCTFGSRSPSAPVRIPLYPAKRFGADDRLPTSQNPLRLAMEASAAELSLELQAGDATQPPRLRSAQLVPRRDSTGITLYCHALADSRNRPLVIALGSGTPVALHVRRSESGVAAGLLLAPQILRGKVHDARRVSGVSGAARVRLPKEAPVEIILQAADRLPDASMKPRTPLDAAIASLLTFPVLRFVSSASLDVPRPGDSYRGSDAASRRKPAAATEAARYTFEGSAVECPLLPAAWCKTLPAVALGERVYARADGANQRLSARLATVDHETALTEIPKVSAPVPLKRALRFAPSHLLAADTAALSFDPRPDVLIAAHAVTRDYGHIELDVRIDPAEARDYVVLWDPKKIRIKSDFRLDPTLPEFQIRAQVQPTVEPNRPVGILKIAAGLTLHDIARANDLARNVEPAKAGQWPELSGLHASLLRPDWVGLILFRVPVDIGGFELLSSLLPSSELRFEYLATAPRRTADQQPSITASIAYRNRKQGDPTTEPTEGQEARFQLHTLDALWLDSGLQRFRSTSALSFKTFLQAQADTSTIDITGLYDSDKRVFRFIGESAKPWRILKGNHALAGVVKELSVRRVEIQLVEPARKDGDKMLPPKAALVVDGNLIPASFSAGGAAFGPARDSGIDFEGLHLNLPAPPTLDWRWLGLEYGGIRLPLDVPAIKLGDFDFKLRGLGTTTRRLSDLGFLALQGNPGGALLPFLEFRLELMKLPQLAAKAVDRLLFDLRVGITDFGKPFDLFAGIRFEGFAFKERTLHLDLMRFLEVRAQVHFSKLKVKGADVQCIGLSKVRIHILGRQVVDNLTARIYSDGAGRRGFILWLEGVSDSGWLQVKWVLVGQNVEIAGGADALKQILAPPAPQSADEQQAVQDGIARLTEDGNFMPATAPIGEWLFSAGFTIVEVFEGKFLFQDNAFYGIGIGGPRLREWLGFDFGISVLYTKGRTAEEDAFHIAVRVPQIVLPAVALLGGEIAISVAMDGSFLFDAGFPWLQSGVRRWDRSFGAIVTPFQGSGGLYLRRSSALEVSVGGAETKALVVAAGYAMQFGLGASFGGGVFTVWARVGIYLVAEGSATLASGQLTRLELVGVLGILGQAAGQLNFWIITARVDILVFAEAEVRIKWALSGANQGASVDAYFRVMARASAHACIGWGPFQVCQGISVELPMEYGPYTLRLA